MSNKNNANKEQFEKIGTSKEAMKFHTNMKRLVALFGGQETFKQSKVEGGSELKELVATLVKDEKEALKEDFLKKAKAIIQRKRDFDKFVKGEIAKMEKVVEAKQKEFNEEMEAVFNIVTKVETIESEYYSTLKDLNKDTTTATPAAEEGDDDEKETE